jgi:hypothetical protein
VPYGNGAGGEPAELFPPQVSQQEMAGEDRFPVDWADGHVVPPVLLGLTVAEAAHGRQSRQL